MHHRTKLSSDVVKIFLEDEERRTNPFSSKLGTNKNSKQK